MNIGDILVRFGADISGFMGGIRTATAALGGFGTAVVAATALAAGLAVILGVVSVKAAADFQQGLNRLVTGAGDVTDNMKQMGQAILGISTATGVLTGELLPAMYLIISAGQRGAQAQNTLKVAAMGAVSEQAKVADVANIVSGAMTDYGTHTYNATQYMNGLIKAVQLGKLTLEQLSVSMGPLMPVAHAAGVSFVDLAAAMSTMTNAQIPADRAATSMRFLMQSLEVPTVKANKAFAKFGVDTTALFNEMKVSVPGALEMIYKAALKAGPYMSKPFVDAVSEMIGGQRSLTAFSALTGSHLIDFEKNVKAVSDAMNLSKTAVIGWDVAQTGFNVKLSQATAAAQALFITIGSALLPVLTGIVGRITPAIAGFTQWLLSSHALETGLKSVGTTIQQAIAWFGQFGPQIALVGAAFTNLVVAMTPLASRMQQANTSGQVLSAVLGALRLIIVGVLTGFAALVSGVAAVIGWFNAGGPAVQRLVTMFQQLGAIITGAFVPAWHSMQQSWADAMNALRPIMPQLQMLAQVLGGIVVASIILVIAVIGGLIVAFAGVLAGVTRIVSGIIQIVSGFVTAVTGYVNLMADLFTGRFDRLRGDLDQIMAGLLQMFIGALNAISGVFQVAWAVIVGFAQGFVDTLVALFQGLWQTLVGGSIVPDMCNGIVAAFSGMVSSVLGLISGFIANVIAGFNNLRAQAIAAISGAVSTILGKFNDMKNGAISAANALKNGVAGALSGLGAIASHAGQAVIDGIVGAINNGIGAVRGAASWVASTIARFLPSSPAKEGALSKLNEFGPALTGGVAAGIRRGTPEVRSAVEMMVAPVPRAVGSVTVGSGTSATRGSGSGGSNAMLDVLLRIERKLDSGRRVTREELIQAMGSTLSERVMQYGSGR